MSGKAFKKVKVRGIIRRDDTLLVVKHKEKHDYFNLPGGKVEKGESLIEALERELEEELGIVPEVGNILFVHQFGRGEGKRHVLEIFFEIKNTEAYMSPDSIVASHAHEIYEQKWIDLEGDDVVLPISIKEELRTYDGTAQYMFVA